MNKLVIGIIILNIVGCGGSESGNPNFYLTASQLVAPVINETTSSVVLRQGVDDYDGQQSMLSTVSFSGSILDKIYQSLREYQFPRDEGVIDMHNIYKVLTTLGQIYETAENSCALITETTVLSPYDLGLGSSTYNCAGSEGLITDAYTKGFAIRESGGTKHALLTYRGVPDPADQEGYGILQGSYHIATGELSLRMVHLTTYPSEEGFVVRTHLEGNVSTHSFSLSSINSGIYANPSWTSIVGTGISRGSGNYFLFKANTSGGVSGGYFCISAQAGLADFQTMHDQNPEGKSTVDTECSDLQVEVDAMTFLVESETPKELADFTGSTILLDF